MAERNDFKLLDKKCLRCFELAKKSLDFHNNECDLTDIQKARYGFYYFTIEQFTSISDYSEITESIVDTDFNNTFFNERYMDFGIDAICIMDNEISIFNFKYRNEFNPDKEQSKNEVSNSIQFFSLINNEDTSALSGKIKELADKIIKCNQSKDIWTTTFYYISNENKTLAESDPCFLPFRNYDIQVKTIGLNEIVEITSIRPKCFDAQISLPVDAIMSFSEDILSSRKSYIARMDLTDLIRITNNDPNLRDKYNIENEKELNQTNIDLRVLFDNVRGFIVRSKFNQNIERTLDEDPLKFFFFNNGITIVADDIKTENINSGKKIKLNIKNFQVLNGGQTLRTIYKYMQRDPNNINNLAKAQILVRLLNVTDESLKGKIGEYTNSQNSISQRDLLSLRSEQIKLQQFLEYYDILYVRKKGDTGDINKNYEYMLSMELMGQMLLALDGHPEMISNKKKEIFGNYYNKLFEENANLLSNDTVNTIKRYFEIERYCRKQKMKMTVQKLMYLLYWDNRKHIDDINEACKKFEKFIEEYILENKIEKSASRILIDTKFKKDFDLKFEL